MESHILQVQACIVSRNGFSTTKLVNKEVSFVFLSEKLNFLNFHKIPSETTKNGPKNCPISIFFAGSSWILKRYPQTHPKKLVSKIPRGGACGPIIHELVFLFLKKIYQIWYQNRMEQNRIVLVFTASWLYLSQHGNKRGNSG